MKALRREASLWNPFHGIAQSDSDRKNESEQSFLEFCYGQIPYQCFSNVFPKKNAKMEKDNLTKFSVQKYFSTSRSIS